ncbi:MAG TPA: hypothetical protein PLX60_13220, partial [Chitinophagales bacterium]|nr:hypothetical protein [Chitinophagales bacterium]
FEVVVPETVCWFESSRGHIFFAFTILFSATFFAAAHTPIFYFFSFINLIKMSTAHDNYHMHSL